MSLFSNNHNETFINLIYTQKGMETREIPVNTYETPRLSADTFDELGNVKVASLRENIKEIEMQIDERMAISQEFEHEGEKMKMEIKNFLLSNAPMGEDDSEFSRERAELRRKKIEINESQLNEKINCWRDIVQLKRDLREKQKELFEREHRMETMQKLLEG